MKAKTKKKPTRKVRFNKKLLLAVRDKMLASPSQVVMESFFSTRSATGSTPAMCGTSACIAGWAVSLAVADGMPRVGRRYGENAHHKAARLLRFSEANASKLFYIGNWPSYHRRRYCSAVTDEQAAKAVASRIDHFIKYAK